MVKQRTGTQTRQAATAGATDDPILGEIVSRLVAELEPERIYLFGSRARGDSREDSDYDVLVLVRERVGEGRAMERRAAGALWGIGVPLDVVIMPTSHFQWMLDAAASLAATAKREGRLLYAA